MPLRTTRIGKLWWVKVPTCVAECGGTVSYAPNTRERKPQAFALKALRYENGGCVGLVN
jgi:hypothetical protein